MKTLIIIPTYNEKENIERLLESLSAFSADILIVDDNSPDGTAEMVNKFSRKDSRIKLLSRQGKLGLASAYIEGFSRAISGGYEYVITMDADLSHPPELIAELTRAGESFVTGSRYVKGGKITGWPFYRHILSRGANFYARTVLGLKNRDLTSGFNFISTALLKEIEYQKLSSEGYGFLIEMKYRAIKKGFSIKEIPITFTERKNGSSKLGKSIIVEAFLLVLRLKLNEVI
ncbi:MAG TPA: dolichyl-phosphate beta-D-mannosyltransferase [Elusimicrobia bacterium]|nr:MAG: hypothetical protein A2278_01675 [Elusimicrobia bacterium RIFOXYA12_FULL_49_49]OGS06756.1 MAG: hypothetical protein A2204_06700 [Elusimicrobia bacterium RIFOXYA1_FULL_47_7]OGS11649.1 MAG: hypothetical protein A2386_03220 [Elusimicrobia bacterium RIFOXYB1_FULL_48_9]OGS16758.1 MAG: hypothetical protein A2251_05125 [Elusimicrobia bacterium RIFOXYA2_FULL_47_53]OGS27039.1 MAG: hypothetical protein A2339_04980 [Elusimicrobia bacterium RIFOXYB12_FULL_50_12]OGS31986.1 MAG: hypothetical protein